MLFNVVLVNTGELNIDRYNSMLFFLFSGITTIDPSWLPVFVRGECHNLSSVESGDAKLPRYDETLGAVVHHVTCSFGIVACCCPLLKIIFFLLTITSGLKADARQHLDEKNCPGICVIYQLLKSLMETEI